MEKTFRQISSNKVLTRREFISAGALATGLLICGKSFASAPVLPLIGELREKFREMQRFGITPAVCWTDPTMRKLLGAISDMNNHAARNGKAEPFAVWGSSPAEQFRSLNLWLGKPQSSAFDASSLVLLEKKAHDAP
jgi:hypothetical protein